MGRLRSVLDWLARRLGLRKLEREVDDEIRFHLEMRAAANRARGMPPAQAEADAQRRFGDPDQVRREGARALAGARLRGLVRRSLDTLGQDLRHSLRRFVRGSGYALPSVLILSLGLSASAAVFSYANNFRRALPGADSQGISQVHLASVDDPFRAVSYPDYQDLATSDLEVLEDVEGHSSGFAASVRHDALTEVAFGQAVTGGFLEMMGVEPALGRRLAPEDDTPGADPAVMVSYEYWQRRYAGSTNVLGRTILLNNEPYTIVGVAPAAFLGTSSSFRPALWLPFEQYKRVYWARDDRETSRSAAAISAYVRLAGSQASARDALTSLAAGLDREAPLETGTRRFALTDVTWIDPAQREAELPTVRLWLAAAVGLLLLACANVANLVLAASTERASEMAMRSALGASPSRIVRQLTAESALLGIVAGGIALMLAGPAARRIGSYFARPSVWGTNVPREVALDSRALLVIVAVSMVTGIVAGVLPALRGSRGDLTETLKGGRPAPGDGGRRSSWFPTGELLIASQVAVSVLLLVSAGLVVRTLLAARAVDVGFDTRGTVASYVSTSSIGTPTDERQRFFEELVERFEALPWVAAATVSDYAPLSPHDAIELELPGADRSTVLQSKVATGYFRKMGLTLVGGRTFVEGDSVGTEPVAVVSESLARRVFGTTDAVGRALRLAESEAAGGAAVQVVGVVEDARVETVLGGPEPLVYLPFAQHYSAPGNALLISARGDPRAAVPMIERELRAVDPRIAIVNVLPYSEVVDGYLYEQRMNAELFALVALLGAILAAAGIFAIASLTLRRRRRELGIRLALGADGASIARLVTTRVVLASGLGLAVGLSGTFLTAPLLNRLLFGVEPGDPVSFLAGAGLLVAASALATYVPARRATLLDPMASLRPESGP